MNFFLLLDLLPYLGENQWIELMPLNRNCHRAIFSLVNQIKFYRISFDQSPWRIWQKYLEDQQTITISQLLPELSFYDCHGILSDLILYTKDRNPKLINYVFRIIQAQITPDNTFYSFSMVKTIYDRIITFQPRNKPQMLLFYQIKAMILDHLFTYGT